LEITFMHHLLFLQSGARRGGVLSWGIRARLLVALLLGTAGAGYTATLSGSFTALPVATNVDLSGEGTLDWGQWGLLNAWGYNHKYGVARQITYSFVTDDYFTDGPYLLDSGPAGFTWTNGTPVPAASNVTNGTSIFGDKLPGNTPTGFQLQCPADTHPRRLKVYVGTSGSQATFTASLTGASTYSDSSFNGATGPLNGVYTLNFQAGSAGQTLTVTFKSTSGSGYMILKAATLAGTNAPPTAAITAPADGTVLPAPATFSVSAAAADTDGTVTNLSLLNGSALLAQAAASTLSRTLSNRPAGPYNLSATATDNLGQSITSFPVNVYITTNGGSLQGSVAAPPASVDLTAEGTTDWAHWGLTAAGSFDHKTAVAQQVPNVTLVNATAGNLNRYTDNFSAYSWIDGTPTAQASGSKTGVFLYCTNNPPAGFQLTVPATNLLRRLKVYVGLFAAQARLDAWLSDWSAPPYSDASLLQGSDNGYAVYTLTYASPNPGAALVVRWTPTAVFDLTYGNVTWQAATLWQQPPAPVLRVASPPAPGEFALLLHAENNATYTVLYADTVDSTNWQVLSNFPGGGADALVVDPAPGPNQRYYRALAQ
jgi:hypothetical protein